MFLVLLVPTVLAVKAAEPTSALGLVASGSGTGIVQLVGEDVDSEGGGAV